jgi:uncharacterized protein YeaO (DUF488 family)
VIKLKRIYEPAAPSDGVRILVERLWPRGVKKVSARLDQWAKEAAPSGTLRRWFHHDPARWDEFRHRYFREPRTERAGELTTSMFVRESTRWT